METKEQSYDNKEVTIKEGGDILLSEMTREQRNIYFSGYDEGYSDATGYAINAFLIGVGVLFAIAIIVQLIK